MSSARDDKARRPLPPLQLVGEIQFLPIPDENARARVGPE